MKIVDMILVGKEPGTIGRVDGRVIGYVEYTMPEEVTSAIELGCGGRNIGVPEGTPTPKLLCEESYGRLIGVAFLVEMH